MDGTPGRIVWRRWNPFGRYFEVFSARVPRSYPVPVEQAHNPDYEDSENLSRTE